MTGQLRGLGVAVDTAEGAEAALPIARRHPPDLVIADLRMPGTCGYAAVWQLRAVLRRPRPGFPQRNKSSRQDNNHAVGVGP